MRAVSRHTDRDKDGQTSTEKDKKDSPESVKEEKQKEKESVKEKKKEKEATKGREEEQRKRPVSRSGDSSGSDAAPRRDPKRSRQNREESESKIHKDRSQTERKRD